MGMYSFVRYTPNKKAANIVFQLETAIRLSQAVHFN
jgi:hypothetical protein